MREICLSSSMRGVWKRGYGKATWAPSDERDGSDMPNLLLPRHIPTLPRARIRGIEDLPFETIWGSAAGKGRKADRVGPEYHRPLRPKKSQRSLQLFHFVHLQTSQITCFVYFKNRTDQYDQNAYGVKRHFMKAFWLFQQSPVHATSGLHPPRRSGSESIRRSTNCGRSVHRFFRSA